MVAAGRAPGRLPSGFNPLDRRVHLVVLMKVNAGHLRVFEVGHVGRRNEEHGLGEPADGGARFAGRHEEHRNVRQIHLSNRRDQRVRVLSPRLPGNDHLE